MTETENKKEQEIKAKTKVILEAISERLSNANALLFGRPQLRKSLIKIDPENTEDVKNAARYLDNTKLLVECLNGSLNRDRFPDTIAKLDDLQGLYWVMDD